MIDVTNVREVKGENMREKFDDFADKYGNGIIAMSSIFLITILTGVLITATGKILVLEFDGLSGRSQDSDGNFEERHFDGGRLKFYAE